MTTPTNLDRNTLQVVMNLYRKTKGGKQFLSYDEGGHSFGSWLREELLKAGGS